MHAAPIPMHCSAATCDQKDLGCFFRKPNRGATDRNALWKPHGDAMSERVTTSTSPQGKWGAFPTIKSHLKMQLIIHSSLYYLVKGSWKWWLIQLQFIDYLTAVCETEGLCIWGAQQHRCTTEESVFSSHSPPQTSNTSQTSVRSAEVLRWLSNCGGYQWWTRDWVKGTGIVWEESPHLEQQHKKKTTVVF